MRILIVATNLLVLEDLLKFGAQIVCRISEVPTILLAFDCTSDRLPPSEEAFQAQVQALDCYAGASTKIRIGYVADQIMEELGENSYDLVIMSEHAPIHCLARLWRKSIVTQVVEHTNCPVLIVRGEIRTIEHILLCDSGGDSSPLLSRLTAQLADLLAGEEQITILHVMSQISAGPGVVGKQLRADAQELMAANTPEGRMLAQDLQVLTKPKVHSQPKVRHGLVLDEILSEAHNGNYDLVVIGAHRGEGWQRHLLDNLAQKIIEQIDRPVLVVK
ncbi:MAG TPA: hypothetical protein DEH25_13145 [Chloroflexi bacterium]|nr:hypothetical protein [Chloroflexota bacterium]HBY07259.1 hypothetical protein [Chloroflexota bacterium]